MAKAIVQVLAESGEKTAEFEIEVDKGDPTWGEKMLHQLPTLVNGIQEALEVDMAGNAPRGRQYMDCDKGCGPTTGHTGRRGCILFEIGR
jgi:hypothetical protein